MESNFIKSAKLEVNSAKDYHGIESISVSGLKKIKVSPAHYKDGEAKEPTDAMTFGTAYHCFILEPEKFEKEYYIFDDSVVCGALIAKGAKSPRATDDYKQWKKSEMSFADGKILLDKEDAEKLKAMKDRLFSHPYAKMLLTNGRPEVGITGTLETMAGQITVKMKPDYIKDKKHIVVDLKTAADASLDGFTRAAADQDYHIQAAFYSDMVELMNNDQRPVTFVFIAQEKIRPYAFNLFECSPQFIGQGRYEYELLLQLYKYCIDNNKWPGYQCFCPNRYGLLELSLPKWAIRSLDYYTY
jgi:exodeoxyribonuclease VIII